jgi:hypothetical protein
MRLFTPRGWTLLAAVLAVWAPAGRAQGIPVVAVYVFGADAPPALNRAMATNLIAALGNSGRYRAAENYREFFNQAAEEHNAAAMPMYSKQIMSLGQRFGVDYVCVAEIKTVLGEKTASARIFDAKTAEIAAEGAGNVPLITKVDLPVAAGQLVAVMFNNAPPPSYAQTPALPPEPAPEPTPGPTPAAPEQGKRTVAVYMAGEEPQGALGAHNILGGELARVLSESDKYTAVDRTEAILEQLDREQVYQRSGAVEDAQIKAIGHQLGVEYLCVSNINAVGKKYYLDTRLVDVVTAEIARSVTATSTLKDANEMSRAGRGIALELLEADKTRMERDRRRLFFRGTAISLDVLGVLAFAYGYAENRNVVKQIGKDNGPEADRAATRRNAAYITGGALIASGVSVHIIF